MFKIGHSYDIHRLEKREELILGGVKINSSFGTVGHSDADVLLHVIIEAMIGAMGKGDIGTLFPDTDDQYKGISSMLLLKETKKILKKKGFKINNIDATIYLEAPKLRLLIDEMRNNISSCLEIDVEMINVKATTGERLGFIGRSEGIAAEAVILINND